MYSVLLLGIWPRDLAIFLRVIYRLFYLQGSQLTKSTNVGETSGRKTKRCCVILCRNAYQIMDFDRQRDTKSGRGRGLCKLKEKLDVVVGED
jgi:hypothetical protein